MNPFAAWIFTVLIAIASPEKRDDYQKQLLHTSPAMQARAGLPDARETREEGEARYRQIAITLDEVLSVEKPLFGGKDGKIWTALLMSSFMKLESGLRLDVDLGLGKWGKGDFGRSFCMMQLQMSGKKGEGHVQIAHPEMETWTGPDVVADRKKCFRAGLEILRRSIGACQTGVNAAGEVVPLTMADRFSAYTKGTCRENEPESRMKWSYASRLFDRFSKSAPRSTPPAKSPVNPPPLPSPAPAPERAPLPPLVVSRAHEHFAYHRSP
jgi:hypothetical protein